MTGFGLIGAMVYLLWLGVKVLIGKKATSFIEQQAKSVADEISKEYNEAK